MIVSPKVAAAATEYEMAARRYRTGNGTAEAMHAAYDAMVTVAYANMNEAYAAWQALPEDTGVYGPKAQAEGAYRAACKDAEQVL